MTPNDPERKNQWNLDKIEASHNTLKKQALVSNVVLAVIDSGIHLHDDLQANIWNNSKPHDQYAVGHQSERIRLS